MAKTPKAKSARTPSLHSRAAKRASSPPSKTLVSDITTNTTPKTPDHHYAGIAKRKTKSKPLTRGKRLRQEKGQARAAVVMEQLLEKKSKSVGKERAARERRSAWEDLNKKVPRVKNHPKTQRSLVEDGWDDESEEEMDGEENGVVEVAEGVEGLKVVDEGAAENVNLQLGNVSRDNSYNGVLDDEVL